MFHPSPGIIIGAVAAGAVVFVLVLFVCYLARKRKRALLDRRRAERFNILATPITPRPRQSIFGIFGGTETNVRGNRQWNGTASTEALIAPWVNPPMSASLSSSTPEGSLLSRPSTPETLNTHDHADGLPGLLVTAASTDQPGIHTEMSSPADSVSGLSIIAEPGTPSPVKVISSFASRGGSSASRVPALSRGSDRGAGLTENEHGCAKHTTHAYLAATPPPVYGGYGV
ncbi:hypothetical protein EIP86_006455 [Pleurotus ostreatoroseus]|nr:hypothetical protein EIP86_006455 [Pleurotus ostreatoroseus]